MLTVEQYLSANNMNWNVVKVPLYAYLDIPGDKSNVKLSTDTTNFLGIVREDTRRMLSVKTDRYTVCQNREAFDWLNEPLQEGATFQECKAFHEGKVVTFDIEFSSSRLNDRAIFAILSASNSHDGSTNLSATSLVAYDGISFRLGSKVSKITAKHTSRSVPRFLESSKFFDTQSATFFETLEDFKRMAERKLSEAQLEHYVMSTLQVKLESLTDRQLGTIEEIKGRCRRGAAGGTIWGAFTGVAQHLTETNNDASLKYGIGLKKINKSLDEAMALLNSK